MKTKLSLTAALASLITLTTLMIALTGCGGYYSGTAVYASGPVGPAIVDDYDYYPGYGFYYSRTHHDYYYNDGNRWVRRPQPPGVRPEQLQAAPSVHMDFHDAPDRHHSTVVKNYPKNWRPPAAPKAPPAPHNDSNDHRPQH